MSSIKLCPIYRCKNCGTKFEDKGNITTHHFSDTEDEDDFVLRVISATTNGVSRTRQTLIHLCGDNEYGISQLVGFRRKDK